MFPTTRTRTNEEWLHDLREGGTAQEPAIADLQHLLHRAVLYIFNRNAVYKLIHEARRKLKSSLESRGFEIGETVNLLVRRGKILTASATNG